MKYRVNYFVELHNPHQADPNMSEGGAARLQFSSSDPNPALSGQPHGIYKIVIQSQVDPVATRDPSNVLGDPKPAAGGTIPTVQVLDFTSDGAAPPMGVDPTVVLPSNGQYGDRTTNDKRNTGYFVLGPSEKASTKFPRNWQADFPYDRNPMAANPVPFTATVAVKDQTFGGVDSKLYAEVDNTFDLTTLPANQPSVFLQRLANPTLPPQSNPAQALYNPYITVDYTTPPAGSKWLNDAVLYDSAGPRNAAGNERQPMNGGANNRISIGRRQPFRATDFSKQMLATPSTITVDNTFFTQNGDNTTAAGGNSTNTLDQQFEWLTHFDRNVTSPMDMLYVSTYHPHELMQQFIPAGSGPNPATSVAHQQSLRVALSNPATRLYRAMEMLGVHSWMHGVPFGGKIPGKININTVWADTVSGDSLVLRCLADSYDTAQRSNAFTQSESETLFQQFLAARTPGGVPSLADQPVWSLAMPNPSGQDLQYGINPPAVTGLTKTLLGRDLVGANVGGTPATNVHPYLKDDLLRKIFNNITTRSNVFAVYVTTGFFTVRDDSTQPVKLGGEVDPQLRHKMFAIVDRTNLTLDGQNARLQGGRPVFFGLNPINPGAAGFQGNLTVNGQNELNFQQTAVGGAEIETVVPAYSYVGAGPNAIVTIRDTVDHNGQEYSATSGEKFDIRPGSVLYLDVASRMEAVIVTEVFPPKAGPDPNNPLSLSTIKIKKATGGNFSSTHCMGCAICTQRLGNPGPQPGISIDYSLPPYANTVVPFSMILQ